MTVVGKKEGFVAQAHLVKIGDFPFADFQGNFDRVFDSESVQGPVPYPAIPTHMLARIWIEKDSLRLHFLNDDWAKNQVKTGKLALAHLDLENGPLLTASTDDLRKFMAEHAEDTAALSENYEFKRSN